ncbi:MAG: c-type cytochrome [Campylobacterota bacterium]|nr:c-type cytochrome [Campylobacterota bacterium]
MKNSLISIVVASLLIGCTSDEPSKSIQSAEKSVEATTTKVVKEAKSSTKEDAQEVKKESSSIMDIAHNSINDMSHAAHNGLNEMSSVAKSTQDSVSKMSEEASKKVDESIAAVKKAIEPVDGGNLYAQKCSSCHGVHAEKKAMNASQIIKGWSSEKTTAALNGYKDGSYGSNMKAIMSAQVNSLNENQIQALANYISKQ